MSNERRKYSRSTMSLPLEVYGYACENGSFTEYTETLNVSPLGASFRLRHPVFVDDILRLALPMPQQLRLFDFEQTNYQIYGQIRRIRPRADGHFNVGVAFISKEPPEIELSPTVLQDETPPTSTSSSPSQAHHRYATTPITPQMASALNQGENPVAKSEPQLNLKLPTIAKGNPLTNDRAEPRAKLRLSLSIRGTDRHGQHFVEVIQTEDVSKHGLCFVVSKHDMEMNAIMEIIGFQGKFNAQGEVRHINFNPSDKNYRIGIRLLGEPSNWIVK